MDFLKLAKKRYACRKYLSRQVEPEKLELILEAGRVAPTGANRQPQRLVVVQSKEGMERLALCSVGMKSSMISFSTNNKDTLKQIADRFNSKDYMIVSYEMETQHSGEMESYQVTMVIKSKRNNDEGHLLSLMQKFPDVTVQRIE